MLQYEGLIIDAVAEKIEASKRITDLVDTRVSFLYPAPNSSSSPEMATHTLDSVHGPWV